MELASIIEVPSLGLTQVVAECRDTAKREFAPEWSALDDESRKGFVLNWILASSTILRRGEHPSMEGTTSGDCRRRGSHDDDVLSLK